jgi:hypothetical protein
MSMLVDWGSVLRTGAADPCALLDDVWHLLRSVGVATRARSFILRVRDASLGWQGELIGRDPSSCRVPSRAPCGP